MYLSLFSPEMGWRDYPGELLKWMFNFPITSYNVEENPLGWGSN